MGATAGQSKQWSAVFTWLPGERATLPLLPPLLRMSGDGDATAMGRGGGGGGGVRWAAAAGDRGDPPSAPKSGLLLRRRCGCLQSTHSARQHV